MTKAKHIPKRTCAGCNQKREKKDLIRVVRMYTKEGSRAALIDLKGKMQGRGVYVCRKHECLKRLRKGKRIERKLRVPYNNTVYDQIKEEILKHE
ncbi:MAG: YlxR family protein [Clostridia bacterium]|nr:YlxR family protein [Clostridia bacterium]